MRAAVLHGPRDVRLEDVPTPAVGRSDVAIQVAHNGLCGSDLKLYEYGLRAASEPHPTTGHCGPQILGHELSGTVVDVGPSVTGIRVGDRVCVEPLYPCFNCPPCRRGLSHLCQILTFHGVVAGGGGLSEVTVVPETMVHVLPGTVSFEQGALIEPMSVGYHAVERAHLAAGDLAVVLGAGPIGIGVLLALRARGVDNVIVAEPVDTRRRVIEGLGAVTVDPGDLLGFLSRNDGGRGGADAVFDCAGASKTFALATEAVRARGDVVVVAGSSLHPLTTTAHLLQHGEMTITGSLAMTSADMSAVIALMAAGAYPTSGWVEHVAFDDVVERGFHDLLAGRRTKVLIDLDP
jgi:(R,R)-butanediol dehydrogenase / meso-butanediol dehydrogenase / diacetyl reductase